MTMKQKMNEFHDSLTPEQKVRAQEAAKTARTIATARLNKFNLSERDREAVEAFMGAYIAHLGQGIGLVAAASEDPNMAAMAFIQAMAAAISSNAADMLDTFGEENYMKEGSKSNDA